MRSDTARAPEWLTTGMPQLDRVLGGGIRRRSTVMVIGPPGIGKTTLAQQIAFQLAAQGAAALYLTGFGETHDKVVTLGQGLNFFVPDLVGQRLHFSSLVDLLQSGREQTEDAVVQTARAVGASLVVLDGFRGLRGFLTDEREVSEFVYSLGPSWRCWGPPR
jgi:circadian clock protein KaiC